VLRRYFVSVVLSMSCRANGRRSIFTFLIFINGGEEEGANSASFCLILLEAEL
jgi:hypothetical protein